MKYTPKKTPKQETKTTTAAEQLNSLLLLFPATELAAFYKEHSAQMLLLNEKDLEKHQALKQLLQILQQL